MRKLTIAALLILALPLFAERLPRLVLPQHYDLTLTPDIDRERFTGELMIAVGVQQPVTSIKLNSAEIEFRSASVEANGERQTATVTTDAANETATLSFAKPLPIGPATVRIAYDGILNRQLRGFYIGESGGKKYAGSQMESTDARRAFPSFDEPDMKATFRITIIANEKHNVISNAAVESEKPGPVAGKKTVRFAMTPRLSTYHIALIVGDFACLSDSVAGIPLRVCATPDRVESGRFALNVTKDIINYYNDYFGIPYPFGKLDQIALADFAAGAMENPGAITYRERVLLTDEKTASPEALRASTSTIAHEIAHMWFGDLVTMRWWDDIWLNEGFASWMGRKGTEAVRPQWKRAVADADAASSPMKSDILMSTRAIHQQADTPAEIEQLFDGIAYGKTAALLRMLENYGGAEKFRSGINLYLRRNSYGNATGGDFAAAIAEQAGGEIADVLSSYVNQAGIPVVNVRSRCDGNATVVDLDQQRFTMTSSRDTSAQMWTIPVCFGGGDCVLLRERRGTFRLNGCRNDLFANDEGRGFYITSYDAATQQKLAKSASLKPSERLALVRDAWFLVRAGKGSIPSFLELASSMRGDRAVASEILTDVSFIEENVISAAERPAIQRWIADFASPLLTSLGWSSGASDTPDDRELRNSVITALAAHGGDEVAAGQARQIAMQWTSKREGIDPSIVEDTIKAAAATGNARLYDAYLAAYRASRSARERSYLIVALSNFHDPVLTRRTLDLSLTPEIRSQDFASVFMTTMSNAAGREIGWKFLNDNWAAIAKKMPPGHIDRVIAAAGQVACDTEWRDRIQSFAAANNLREASQSTAQASERIASCAAMRGNQSAAVAEWLHAHPPVSTQSQGQKGR